MSRHLTTGYHRSTRMLLNPFDLVGIALQPSGHIARDLIDIECAMVRKSQNRRCTVVTTDDDKALILTGIKDIVIIRLYLALGTMA